VDVVRKHSAWAEPERRRSIKSLDGEHESRLLKKRPDKFLVFVVVV